MRIALALLLAALFLVPLFPGLTVREGRSGKMLLALGLKRDEAFSLRFIHSVNLSPVTDMYWWNGREIVLQSTLFRAYGWGMPVLADGIGTKFETTPAGFLISGIDRPQAEIPVLLQQVPDHHILYRGREISLLSLAGSGAFIRIAAERINLLSVLIYSH